MARAEVDRTRRVLLAGIVALAVLTAAAIVTGVLRQAAGTDAEPAATGGPWRTDAVLDTPRDDFGTAVVSGRIWVVGGMTGERGNKLDSVEVYDPDSDAWSFGPDMPTARSSMGTAAVGGVIYTMGGSTPDTTSDAMEALDTASGTWRRLAPLPTPRYELAAVAVGQRIYAIGGEAANGPVGTVEVYDTRTGRWSAGPPMPKPRQSLRAVLLDGLIYAIGGIFADLPTRDVQVLDPRTGRWSQGPKLPGPVSNYGLGAYDGELHVMLHTHHWTYRPGDPAGWRTTPPMPTTRHGQGVATLDGRMYVVGGCYQNPLRDLKTVESYRAPSA